MSKRKDRDSEEAESEDSEDNHLENIYKLLNEHTALIAKNQQAILNISTELVKALSDINENLKKLYEKK